MKLVYLGDFSQPWHTESHVAREFEALGHEVVRRHGGNTRGLIEACDDADLVLLQANGGLQSNNPAWLREVERRGARTASYHLDLFVGLKRQARIDTDIMWRTQKVFTADGDPNTQAFLAAKGIEHHWLPAACVSDECVPGTWRDEYDYDVVFVGAENYHAEWPWRRTLIDGLRAHYGVRFKLFDHHPPTRGLDLNDLYATARIVVGDSLALPGHTNYWSDRYYETLGRGGFLVAPDVPGIRAHFTADHLAFYEPGNLTDALATVDLFLDHPTPARRFAEQGQAHVWAHHTYAHRAAEMLAALDLAVAA